jgi:kynurenine formamidase
MAAMFVALSYPLSERTPFYSGLEKPHLSHLYDLAAGDTCNSLYFRTSNHAGTHVDAPAHFNLRGRGTVEYDVNELVFARPAIVDVQLERGELIRASHLAALASMRQDCDVLLLRTGFGAYRGDEHTYVEDSPGFSAEAARYILDVLPQLRALAMDFISAASMKHMEEGCDAHRVFLGCAGYSDRTVLLVEDASLPTDLTTPKRIIIVPWRFEGLDSAPCTVLAEY